MPRSDDGTGFKPPPARILLLLMACVVMSWGTMWVVMKVVVAEVSPLWAIAIRNGIAAVGLGVLLAATGRFRLPKRGDWPIILAISLMHMSASAVLMATGLQHVPVGRSVVLAYTTPLWVAPAAWLILKEPMPARRVAGVLVGLVGTAFLFNPASFDWQDEVALAGNAMLLLSALFWSGSILYTRVHRWVSSPIQLVPWQALLSALVLAIVARSIEGAPAIAPSPGLIAAFSYCSLVGVVLAYWGMTIVNSSLPATTTSLGFLATPVVGMLVSALTLGEAIDGAVLLSFTMIIAGVAIGTSRR